MGRYRINVIPTVTSAGNTVSRTACVVVVLREEGR